MAPHREILAIEFQHLTTLNLDFNLEITGFGTAEIDFIIDGPVTAKLDPADAVIEPVQDQPAITKSGDLWHLGQHRLYCGDSLDEASYKRLMGQDRARMVFTDPPYNVPINGHVCGNGTIKHRDFAMGVGEMTGSEFTEFLANSLKLLRLYSEPGALAFCCMDWRHMSEILNGSKAAGYVLKNLCVWVKNNGGMGSLYRSRHELIFVFKNG